MNKKFQRALSSVLAFVMLCSCMMVANVSSVLAATESWTCGDTLPTQFSGTTLGGSTSRTGDITFDDGRSFKSGTKANKVSSVKFEVTGGGTLKIYATTNSNNNTATPKVDNSATISGTLVTRANGTAISANVVTVTFENAGTYTVDLTRESLLYAMELTDNGSSGDTPVDPATKYTVTITEPTNGTLSVKDSSNTAIASGNEVAENTVLTITATPNEGYELETLKVEGAELNSDNTCTVNADVTISATFKSTSTGGDTPVDPTPSAGTKIHNFTTDDKTSDFYTIAGSLSTSKGTVSYNGLTLTQCLKMETSTSVTFTAPAEGKLTLVFVEPNATIKVDGTKYTAAGDGIITVDVAAGFRTIAKADTANLFYMVYTSGGTTPVVEKYTVTVNVTDGTKAVTGATVELITAAGKLTATEAGGAYTVANVAKDTAITGVNVTASGYKAYTDSTSRTITADTTIDVVLTAGTVEPTPTKKPITVTVYDYNQKAEITTGGIHYWTTLEAASTTEEYKINSGSVIKVTEIADENSAVLPDNCKTEDKAKAEADMQAAIAAGKLYVTAIGYEGAEVTLPAEGNVNVLLTPLADVNIAEKGVYEATPSAIAAALLKTEANYAYQNPYIKNASVNGFIFTAVGNDPIKAMPKVNTRNSAVKVPYVQLLEGVTVEYTPAVNGTLTIEAANTNTNTQDERQYTFNGQTVKLTGTGTTMVPTSFKDLKGGTKYTLNVDSKGINVGSIKFVPDTIQTYTITLPVGVTGTVPGTDSAGNPIVNPIENHGSYPENSQITINVDETDASGNKALVKVNGTIVTLTNGAYTFTLSENVEVEVTYPTTAEEAKDQLQPINSGETVNFNEATNLVRQNTAYTGNNGNKTVKYFADAVSAGGEANVLKLSGLKADNYMEVIAGEDGNIAINFNSNDLVVYDSKGAVVATLNRSTDKASANITRSFEAKKGERYTIKASGGNAYVNSVSLLADGAKAGHNIASIVKTEDITNTDILLGYGIETPDLTNNRYVRVVGQLNGIDDETKLAAVEGAGIVVIDTTLENWDKSTTAFDQSVTKVYTDVYSSANYDPLKRTPNGTYTGDKMGNSPLNTYFDMLIYGKKGDFNGSSICAYTVVDNNHEYYNSDAKLAGQDF